MDELFDEQKVLKMARRMSFHMLKTNIVNQFKAIDYNSQNIDHLGELLNNRSEKLMDIFIQAAWERRPVKDKYAYGVKLEVEPDLSLDEYKKQTLETLEKLKTASRLTV